MTKPSRRVPQRAAAALVLLAAVVGACGDDDEPEDASRPSGEVPTTAAEGAGPSTSGSVPATSPTTGAPPGATAGPGPAPAPAPTSPGATPAPTVASPAPAPAGVGAFAPFYLRPAQSTRIVLEIRSQSGAAPREASVSHLRRVLAETSGKEVVVTGGTVGGGARQWTADQIRAEGDRSGVRHSRDAAVMRLLYLRGGFAEGEDALGVAVRSDVAAVFSDRVDEAAGLVGDPARIEDAVTVHEAGHLLGLVDLFLDTGRADPEHPGHSSNPGSVMYYAVESTLVGSILDGGPPTEFDADDRAELAAIRRG